jgi:hypothetical protein
MDCINLMDRFGSEYRIEFDPAFDPKHKQRENLDAWMMTLPCRFGVIYPWGGDRLSVEVDYHLRIAKRLAALPGVTLTQDGDEEKTFTFPVSIFDEVAKIVQPRRRRHLSDEQKAKAAETLRPFRYAKQIEDNGAVPQQTEGVEP